MAKRITVFSGKGGVGKSSVTVCLAIALSGLGKKVLLVDADIGFRSLDLILNTGAGVVFNFVDVIDKICEPSAAIVPGGEGMPSLLTAPNDYSDSITAENIDNMLKSYDEQFDYIFIDSPAGAGGLHNMLFEICDNAILVATPDVVSVRSAASAADKAFAVNKKAEIKLIINRFNKQEVLSSRQMKIDDVIDSVRVGLLGVVPEDDSIRLLPEGRPLVKYASDSFLRLAKRFIGENVAFNPKKFY